MVEIRRLVPDDWADWRAVRLRALEEAPDAFGSTLADWRGDRDAEPRWRGRLENVPLNSLAVVDGRLVGQLGGTAPDPRGYVELISMWVAPEARGQSVADALISDLVEWASEQSALGVVLWVKRANRHAIEAYRRNGFTTVPGAVRDDEQLMSLRF